MTKRFFIEEGYQRSVFNAIPSPSLVLDHGLKVLDANLAAFHFFGKDRKVTLKRLCGEVLQCLNEKESDAGCGSSQFCKDCVIRNSVLMAIQAKDTYREKYDMQLSVGDEVRRVNFLVTASPFIYKKKSLVLVILEDITELTLLQKIVPICSKCKKIRNEENNWESIESYFKRHIEPLQFTHGLCPDCQKQLYPEFHLK